MVFKSKVDWRLVVIVFGVLAFPGILGIVEKKYLLSLLSLLIIGLVLLLFSTIQYKIEGAQLIVWKTKIDIKSIRKVYKTSSPLSSPALSLDRIAVCYNQYDEILISPKEKEVLINELLKINPDIEVKI